MSDPIRDAQLVTEARRLERLLARRRKLVAKLDELDGEVHRSKKLLRDMTARDYTLDEG